MMEDKIMKKMLLILLTSISMGAIAQKPIIRHGTEIELDYGPAVNKKPIQIKKYIEACFIQKGITEGDKTEICVLKDLETNKFYVYYIISSYTQPDIGPYCFDIDPDKIEIPSYVDSAMFNKKKLETLVAKIKAEEQAKEQAKKDFQERIEFLLDQE